MFVSGLYAYVGCVLWVQILASSSAAVSLCGLAPAPASPSGSAGVPGPCSTADAARTPARSGSSASA